MALSFHVVKVAENDCATADVMLSPIKIKVDIINHGFNNIIVSLLEYISHVGNLYPQPMHHILYNSEQYSEFLVIWGYVR